MVRLRRAAYIRRDAQGFAVAERMLAETLGRVAPLARYLLPV